MKRIVPLFFMAMAWRAAAASPEIVDGVAAVVNDSVITYSEVRLLAIPAVEQLRQQYAGDELLVRMRAAHMDALNQLIDRALILQKFKEKGYSIPDNMIDRDLSEVIANEFGGNRESFIKTLEAQKMTLAQYRERLRERIIVQAMRSKMVQQEIVVSPAKMEKYYQDKLEEYKVGDQIKLRMIVVRRPPSTNSVSADTVSTNGVSTNSINATNSPAVAAVDPRRTLAGEILAKLEAGESFDNLAHLYSEAKEAKDGGDWGWITRDHLREELREAAFQLKPGQHSKVVETADGYYILQVDDVQPARVKPLAEVRDQVENILLQQKRAKLQEEWVKQLRAKAYIHIF
jgi:parvulin-like peptidyl-prolyl isomerase